MLKMPFWDLNQKTIDMVLRDLSPGITPDDGMFEEFVLFNTEEEILQSYPKQDEGFPAVLKLNVSPREMDYSEEFSFAAVTFYGK